MPSIQRALVAIFMALMLAGPAAAQIPPLPGTGGGVEAETEVAPPPPTTEIEVRALLATLTDDQVRDALLAQMDRDVAARAQAAEPRGPVAFAVQNITGAFPEMEASFSAVPLAIYNFFVVAIGNFAEPRGVGGVIAWFMWFGGALLLGAGGYAVAIRAARGWRALVREAVPVTLGQKVGVLVRRVLLDFGGIIAFATISLLVVNRLMPEAPRLNREVADAMINQVILLPLFVAAVSRFLMAPQRPELRLVAIDDFGARRIHIWLVGLAALLGFQNFAIPFVLSHGVSIDKGNIGFLTNFLFYVALFWFVWRFRAALQSMMRGGADDADLTSSEISFARIYPKVGMGLIAGNWFLIMILIGAGRYDLLHGQQNDVLFLVLMAPVLDTMVRGLVKNLMPPMKGDGPIAEQAYANAKRAWIRIGRVMIAAMLIIVAARTWGINGDTVASGGAGLAVLAGLLKAMMILAIGYLMLEFASLWSNRLLANEMTSASTDPEAQEDGGEGGARDASRLSTVLPLVRVTVQASIAVLTVLIALSNLGVDITPLLAGAGIVGLAIGFGAQKLVTDVVSGIFFLIDDAFRVGEYVDVGDTLGTVEKISVRSLRLRHHRGAIHTIPFGEIPKVTNYSRDWVIVKLKFTVAFDTDPEKVRKIFKNIGKEMMAIPAFAADFLQPFKSQGVFDVDDVGIVVRGKFMAKPGRQFTLRKEVYQRVNQAFEQNGISFARKEVVVRVGETPNNTTAANLAAAGAAAAAAIEQPVS
ncbi:MAG: small-conductance mechanosensitive channel [Paracoccaceae bacterium]|jgi:small-conductance mechanosensitive channel